MKNLLLLFVLSCSQFISAQLFSHKDTLRFAPDSSYSRVIKRFEGKLLFGTSKSGLISFDENTGKTVCLYPPKKAGEIRDLEINKKQIFIMHSGDTGLLVSLKKNKHKVLLNKANVFLDDILLAQKSVLILGDPLDSHFYIQRFSLKSKKIIPFFAQIKSQKDEACFAGSGTTAFHSKYDYYFISGGGNSVRLHIYGPQWRTSMDLPMNKGTGAGPFSICFTDELHGVIVGGDYLSPNKNDSCSVYTFDRGRTWELSPIQPKGYRCCVVGNKSIFFTCGSNGIDYSLDYGKTWQGFDTGNFCALLLEEKYLYATTNKGYCIRYSLP